MTTVIGDITFMNNGNANVTPATYDANGNLLTPAIPASPTVSIVDPVSGNTITLAPGDSTGVAYPPNLTYTGS